jgi:hypothetical protein
MLGTQLRRAGPVLSSWPALLQSTPVSLVQRPSPFVMHLYENRLDLYEHRYIFTQLAGVAAHPGLRVQVPASVLTTPNGKIALCYYAFAQCGSDW